ncbi:hypothetical protein BAJUN_00810 [Bajunvirus bajun]|uniref:Uncharacterized protein n=1 Tax=Brevundimonas phage vB_BgoS-Bajun TaxID=2948594 RepID=A0A9E7N4F6_9CAUD|nr:hypothetical protein BAJUN_00810 [Brevundimonas phage vB_BgoS-Bajun]
MAIGEARWSVTCDGRCGETFDDYEGTALAGGGYDARFIPATLRREGWLVDLPVTICPDCKEEAETAIIEAEQSALETQPQE